MAIEIAPRTQIDFASLAARFIREGQARAALDMLRDGLRTFPNDPVLTSHYGRVMAESTRERREGERVCRDALEIARKTDPKCFRQHGGTLYVNLSAAILARRHHKAAVQALREGLREAPGNPEIIAELERLCTRQRPPLKFLDRGHVLNRTLGRIIFKLKGRRTVPSS